MAKKGGEAGGDGCSVLWDEMSWAAVRVSGVTRRVCGCAGAGVCVRRFRHWAVARNEASVFGRMTEDALVDRG